MNVMNRSGQPYFLTCQCILSVLVPVPLTTCDRGRQYHHLSQVMWVGVIGYVISEIDVLFASQFLLINPCVEETFTFDLCIHVNNELMEKVPAPQ